MTPESSFQAFRTTRDPARLGEVFDLCADDLFAVALHLCRERAEAEDALQATFLVAIEQCLRWVPGRPLQPWLLGILHREVQHQRRRARRQPRPERVAMPSEQAPDLAAMDAEARASVRAAIEALPEPYRGVVALRLEHALSNDAIAAKLLRSPGAVRTQLWRGLELLRRALPAGLGVALGSQLLGQPALAAVRGEVLAAARAAAKGTVATVAGGGVVFAGALLMKKLAMGAVLLAACVWAAWPRGGEPAAPVPFDSGMGGSAAMVAAPSPPDEPQVRSEESREVATVGATAAPTVTDTAAVPVVPHALRIQVVDRRSEPVVDASVAWFAPDRSGRKPGEPAEHRVAAAPLQVARTDSLGRCELSIDGEGFVAATKDGVGTSGDVRVMTSEREVVLRMTAAVRIRGTVLQADGAPAAAATVEIWRNGFSNLYPPAVAPPPMVTDERGTFSFDVVPPGTYRMRAHRGDAWCEAVDVDVEVDDGERVVTLQFPGAFSLRGVLLGSDGAPLADGMVAIVGEGLRRVGKDGTFRLLRTEGGTLSLYGGAPGQTLARATVELDAARPHQSVTLRTTPFVPLAGRIVDERGLPIAGIKVFASDAQPYDAEVEARWRVYDTGMPRAVTDADGTFRWLVPADLRFRIAYRPIPGDDTVTCKGPEVAPPVEDLVVVVPAAELQRTVTGFELRGTIVADATGAPVAAARVKREFVHEGDGSSSALVDAKIDAAGRFVVGPMPLGDASQIAFEFEAEGLAPLRVGPFAARAGVQEVAVRLPALATVDVLVLRADGTPAFGAAVVAHAEELGAFGPSYQLQTGADGRAHFASVRPAAYTVRAWLQGANVDLAATEVAVRPGGTHEVRLTLPR